MIIQIMLFICTISGKEAAVFKHHSGPITSVEWHPLDSTVFASAGADDQVSLFHHILPSCVIYLIVSDCPVGFSC